MATTTTKKKTAPSATKHPGADYGREGMVIPQGHPEQMLETQQQQQQAELIVPGSGQYDTRPLFGAAAVQFIRLSMFNPLRGFSPRRLSSWIEEQEAGQLSGALRAWEAMARRDDAIVTVKGKKEDAVAMRGYALLEGAATKEDRGLRAEAKSQRERLRYFWENMRCVSAWDRNVSGGFSLFARLCVHIQSLRYGAIHFNWRITARGLTAELEFVPGWLFENLTGELRFLGTNPACVYGMPLDSTNWLPIAGRGIMEAASIAYGYKHLGLETWIKYCARYGMPFPIGTCPSGPQSPEWAQMKAAIKGINDDGGAVIGEGAKIELLKAEGSAGVSPSKDLVERLDRALSAMFRGGDLSTMSSTSGHGTGSHQQTGESLLMEAADCQFVSEIMQAIERKVLDYYDGEEAEALVYGQIKGPSLNDAAQELRVDEFAVKYGVRLSITDWAERHNRALADEDEPVLETKPQADPSAKDAHAEDDDHKAVNFDPNEPRDASGKWTAGAGVARKGPQIKVTRGDTKGDPADAYHTLENPILGGADKDVKEQHAVFIVPMVDGKPDYSKVNAELQLMSTRSQSADAKTEPLDPDTDYPGEKGDNDLKPYAEMQKEAAEKLPKPEQPYWEKFKKHTPASWLEKPDAETNKLLQHSPADIVRLSQSMGGDAAQVRADLDNHKKRLLEYFDAHSDRDTRDDAARQIERDTLDALADLQPKAKPETEQERLKRHLAYALEQSAPVGKRPVPKAPPTRDQYTGNPDDYTYFGPPGLAAMASTFEPTSEVDVAAVEHSMRQGGYSDEVIDKYMLDFARQAYQRRDPTGGIVDSVLDRLTMIADMSNRLNILRGGKSYAEDATDAEVGPQQLFYEWVHGRGPKVRHFDENSVMGKYMLNTDYVAKGINEAMAHVRSGTLRPGDATRSLGKDGRMAQIKYPFDFAWDAMLANPGRAFQGSIAGTVTPGEPYQDDGEDDAVVPLEIRMEDVNSAISGTRFPPFFGGYKPQDAGGAIASQPPSELNLNMPLPSRAETARMQLQNLVHLPADKLAGLSGPELRALTLRAMKPQPVEPNGVRALVPYNNPYGENGPLRTLYVDYKMHIKRPIDARPEKGSMTFQDALDVNKLSVPKPEDYAEIFGEYDYQMSHFKKAQAKKLQPPVPWRPRTGGLKGMDK